MYNAQKLQHVKNIITKSHSGDKEQLSAIFSDAKRLIVEAPAGYGKTKTMISKIAYILATEKLSSPKKILALTFSVNAAYKIKKDVSEHLPNILQIENSALAEINHNVFISNYHGFCRHLLKLYGYLIHKNLMNIDIIHPIDDSKIESLTNVGISYEDAKEMSDFCDAIKEGKEEYIRDSWKLYLKRIKAYMLPNGHITYNSIILFTLQLFSSYPHILQFYLKYFPVVIVDEFQDTNFINYALLRCLISENTEAVFIGDPLQRIYGFIGAIPNLMERAKNQFNMQEIRLKKNYRFQNNAKMLLLDRNIRLNAENPSSPQITESVIIDLKILVSQLEEAEWVQKMIQDIIHDSAVKIAVLIRNRGHNADKIIERFENVGIEYFYGLYTEDDRDYINFHRECLNIFMEHLKTNNRITKLNLKKFYGKVQNAYLTNYFPVIQSLLSLLEIFINRLADQYHFLANEDKINFILDTLENRVLKQQMEYVQKQVILSTVHGAKGLEWDYIILPDMEQYVFPNYYGLCGVCNFKHNRIDNGLCQIVYDKNIEKQFLEELSVYYVSVTRAKKDVYFSSSKTRIHYTGKDQNTYISCLLSLPGIICKLTPEGKATSQI